MRRVLWWGRFDPGYARNRILRALLAELGWLILDFRPYVSVLGDLEAGLRQLPRPDLVWVPCFRQRDLAAARRWAKRHRVPLLADPLISAYDKQVFERGKLSPDSLRARRLRAWEGRLLRAADVVLADTASHADFFRETFAIPADRLAVVPVGAEEALFRPCPPPPHKAPALRVLFYGSFIPLQGPETIVEAARLCAGAAIDWTLVGDGALRPRCARQARGLGRLRFEPWLPFAELPARICAADVVLGIFGTTPKAARVIPNKVYQALACARAVVTQGSAAYPPALRQDRAAGLFWVPAGDAQALADTLRALAADREALCRASVRAGETYQEYFATAQVRAALQAALELA